MITTEKAVAGILAVTLVNGFFSTNMMKKYKSIYSDQLNELKVENTKLKDELSEYFRYGVEVDVTMYQPVYPQTD